MKQRFNYFKSKERTNEELNAICTAFFEALVVPLEWRFMSWVPIVDEVPMPGGTTEQKVISVGKVFRDQRTSGIDLMHYKVVFFTFSERGGLVEKKMIDFGKCKYHCITQNLTIEKLNFYIEENYRVLKPIEQ